MELRRRRGLMIALIVVNIGLPAGFLLIRLLAHAFAPYANPPAGGFMIFVVLAALLAHLRLHHRHHGGLHRGIA